MGFLPLFIKRKVVSLIEENEFLKEEIIQILTKNLAKYEAALFELLDLDHEYEEDFKKGDKDFNKICSHLKEDYDDIIRVKKRENEYLKKKRNLLKEAQVNEKHYEMLEIKTLSLIL